MTTGEYSIRAENIAKRYEIGARQRESDTVREQIMRLVRAPFDRYRKLSGTDSREPEHWALRDVSFEVRRGEALGIIGRNGAGKSTLLKVLSRITEPTAGRILINGRVASLLEVGTGFHSELSGRENIYLNGAILGMSRAEIARKFDAIVEFAEVEKFLDTPVKRYSSGMYMRLAFAVAANLEPDILLVDEVLAVGDMDFQKKCVDRMRGLAGSNTTVILVSHNMSSIQALCNRCLLLDQGRSVCLGDTANVLQRYMEAHAPTQIFTRKSRPGNEPSVTAASLEVVNTISDGQAGRVRLEMEVHASARARVGMWLRIKDRFGVPVAIAEYGTCDPDQLISLDAGANQLTLDIKVGALAVGDYVLSITTVQPGIKILDDADDALWFTIERKPKSGAPRSVAQSWGYGSAVLEAEYVSPWAAGTDAPCRSSSVA